jgi:hypothetical protein
VVKPLECSFEFMAILWANSGVSTLRSQNVATICSLMYFCLSISCMKCSFFLQCRLINAGDHKAAVLAASRRDVHESAIILLGRHWIGSFKYYIARRSLEFGNRLSVAYSSSSTGYRITGAYLRLASLGNSTHRMPLPLQCKMLRSKMTPMHAVV